MTILWALLAAAVIALALYRKLAVASRQDYDLIHVGPGEEELIPQQRALSEKLDAIDKWGKILTMATLIFGLAIASVYLYQAWVASQRLG
ncbi:MAG TPA: hypothetical protein VMB85_10605 [Bryobacteraceae bacterium]|nr:hypothetical protein [Bryobacteraceae bacterium]